MPPWQMSFWLQALPSSQRVPSLAAGFEQAPVDGLHTPATWHWSCAVQTTRFPPVQVPFWHVSVCVQASRSSQLNPLGAAGSEQTPVAGLHTPGKWHWSLASQTTGLVPVQTPARQTSVCVQASPSLQAVPSLAAGFAQAPVAGFDTPGTWHWSWA